MQLFAFLLHIFNILSISFFFGGNKMHYENTLFK